MADKDETTDEEASTLESDLGGAFDKIAGGKGGDSDADDDDDQADDEEKDDDADDDSDDDADHDDDDADDEEKDDDKDDDADDDEEADEDDDDDDADDDDDDDEETEEQRQLRNAAERHRIPTEFEDVVKQLPKEQRRTARALFATRLSQMESGLGRAFSEARSDRVELNKLSKRIKFEEENRVDHFATILLQKGNESLIDEIQAEIDKRTESDAYREGKQMRLEDAKKKLMDEATTEATAQERQTTRADAIESLGRRLCREEGIPYELGVEKALHIAILNSDPDVMKRNISDEGIRAIVKRESKIFRKATGQRRQKESKEYVRDKIKERADGRRRVTARDRGRTPTPGRAKEPKSLEDALLRRAAKIVPDMPAG